MNGDSLKLPYLGLIRAPMPSGNVRWLVRAAGDKTKRITLTVSPDHPEFHEIYRAARAGIKMSPAHKAISADKGTLGWLGAEYLTHLASMVDTGTASNLPPKQRRGLMPHFLNHLSSTDKSAGKPYSSLPTAIPDHELVLFRDSLMATPGKAKNMFKMLKAMFVWATARGHAQSNPAAAVSVAYTSKGGAKPWTLEDLKRYRTAHPPRHDGTLVLDPVHVHRLQDQ